MQLNPTTGELFWYFLKLGWLAFGGPVGQIGLMHLQVVERQKWLEEEEFVRALNFCHLLPGPEALQLAIYIGYRKGGYAGGALAGASRRTAVAAAPRAPGPSLVRASAARPQATRTAMNGTPANE